MVVVRLVFVANVSVVEALFVVVVIVAVDKVLLPT